MIRGWCLAGLGRTHEGIALLDEGVAAHRMQVVFVSFLLLLQADAYRRAGRTAAGLTRLVEAVEVTNASRARWFEAETHRLRGELLRDTEDHAMAKASFRTAIDIARRRDAKLWELRSSASLAQMLRDQGKRKTARDLLTPV
jgi:hypothetical protein